VRKIHIFALVIALALPSAIAVKAQTVIVAGEDVVYEFNLAEPGTQQRNDKIIQPDASDQRVEDPAVGQDTTKQTDEQPTGISKDPTAMRPGTIDDGFGYGQ
jgi:hypothetical protein